MSDATAQENLITRYFFSDNEGHIFIKLTNDTKEDKKTEKAADALQTAVMLADQAPELQAEAAILIEASSGSKIQC